MSNSFNPLNGIDPSRIAPPPVVTAAPPILKSQEVQPSIEPVVVPLITSSVVESQPSAPPPMVEQQQIVQEIVREAETKINITPDDAEKAAGLIRVITTGYSQRMVGQDRLKRNLMISLLSNSHVLLESVPGLAKSLAASTLANTISGVFNRIQCTADLMPSDISGSQIFNQKENTFETQKGPVFANILLLDEINRSSAKSQSAMLEAMAERQVSIGGETYGLPNPFLVIATQNPVEQEGVYHLAEAQLDRFLIKDVIDYPEPLEELEILNRVESGVLDSRNQFVFENTVTPDDILFLQDISSRVYVDDSIKQYIINLVYATRNPEDFLPAEFQGILEMGASPRATIGFMIGAKALALLNGRTHVLPEDVKELRHEILRHRLLLSYSAINKNVTTEQIIDLFFSVVPVP